MVFSGLVDSTGMITALIKNKDLYNLEIETKPQFSKALELGSSICVDGVCLTVISLDKNRLSFDVIMETLKSTTLGKIEINNRVNLERSIKLGDEIGGHLISGHVSETITIVDIQQPENNYIISFKVSDKALNYIFSKGYVAINGVSLTVGKVSKINKTFNVYLIPETLVRTNLSDKNIGDSINLEIDSQTQSTVDTVTRIIKEQIDA